jgi:hypothetical protein
VLGVRGFKWAGENIAHCEISWHILFKLIAAPNALGRRVLRSFEIRVERFIRRVHMDEIVKVGREGGQLRHIRGKHRHVPYSYYDLFSGVAAACSIVA